MNTPLSVPAECVDMLPPEMWQVYWEMFPDGRQELPATVPPGIWKAHMKQFVCRDATPIPPPPPIWKAYWGRVSSGPAMVDRKRKPADKPQRGPPQGPEPPVPAAFWERYFQIFPRGHCMASEYAPLDGKPAYDELAAVLPRYIVRSGAICIRVSGDTEPPVYVKSTGCDSFDKRGRWAGPG
jgi:hypothetical protein